jgi:hypothetical protein
MDDRLQRYRDAVKEAIEDGWRAGLPAFQIRDGYLVAIYPGGREVKLKKTPLPSVSRGNGEPEALDSRRAERRR